jgi:hypothetical protein
MKTAVLGYLYEFMGGAAGAHMSGWAVGPSRLRAKEMRKCKKGCLFSVYWSSNFLMHT